MKEHLSGLLEGNSTAVARLERSNENLEGQVEQLTISLVDATSKKSDAEKRLRQYQQVRAPGPLSNYPPFPLSLPFGVPPRLWKIV